MTEENGPDMAKELAVDAGKVLAILSKKYGNDTIDGLVKLQCFIVIFCIKFMKENFPPEVCSEHASFICDKLMKFCHEYARENAS